MKNLKLKLSIFVLICSGNFAHAQTTTPAATAPAETETTKNLVTITGNLDPSYSIEMTEADRIAIAKGLEGINNLPVISVDINSIYSEKDKPAFEAASKEVSRVILEASKTIVNMRAIVYKLDVALQRNNSSLIEEKIYQTLNRHFQRSFTSLLQLFLGPDGNFNKSLTESMEGCFSYSCVQDIAAAQMDLISFGRAINHRIDLESSRQWVYSHSGFQSRLVKDAVRETVDRVLKVNESESVYVKMLRAAASPFAAAASGAVQSVENLGNFIRSNKAVKLKIAANPIKISRKQWLADVEAFETIIANNFEVILDKNNGARLYENLNDMLNTTSSDVSDSNSSRTALSKQLTIYQQIFNNLSKTNALDDKTASDMLLGMLSGTGDEYKKYLDEKILPVLNAAKAAGLVPIAVGAANFPVRIPHSLYNKVSYSFGHYLGDQNGYNAIQISPFSTTILGSVASCIAIIGDTAVRVLMLESKQNPSVKFVIIIEDKTSNYFENSGGKVKIKQNPIPLTVKLTKISP